MKSMKYPTYIRVVAFPKGYDNRQGKLIVYKTGLIQSCMSDYNLLLYFKLLLNIALCECYVIRLPVLSRL